VADLHRKWSTTITKATATNSAKPVGVGAASQHWISCGRTIWIADAHRGDGQRLVVRADGKLTAFVELEAVIPNRSFSF
jgi:hypothetical protein